MPGISWADTDFISYRALNNLLRSYVTAITTEEINQHEKLYHSLSQRYKNDETLKPIKHRLEEPVLSAGDRLADNIARFGGSWPFIIIFFAVLMTWMAINVVLLSNKGFDPYPFILLNLVLSCLAAVQAPIIMMSQNRQATKDRQMSDYDFKVNLKAETEVQLLHQKMDHLLTHHHKDMVEMFELQVDLLEQLDDKILSVHKLIETNFGHLKQQ